MKLIFWQHACVTAGKHFTPYLCSCINHQRGESDKHPATHILHLIKGSERRLGQCRPCAAAGGENNSFSLQLLIREISSYCLGLFGGIAVFHAAHRMFILNNHGLQVLKFPWLFCERFLCPVVQVTDKFHVLLTFTVMQCHESEHYTLF